jgi:hypothetical protein
VTIRLFTVVATGQVGDVRLSRWRSSRAAIQPHEPTRTTQGAGDAVHDLDAGDHQPAQLIQTGGLHPGDDVVGAGEVLGQRPTIQVAERLRDLAGLRSG